MYFQENLKFKSKNIWSKFLIVLQTSPSFHLKKIQSMGISMTEMKALIQKGMIDKGQKKRYQIEAITYEAEVEVNS